MSLVQEAEPEALRATPEQSVVSASVNVTVPVRSPEPGATAETFAMKVTG
jgi:hypothetical protein